MDADLIVKLGFFIADLHRQIQELHQKQFGSDGFKEKFIVYLGQGMEKREFEKMVGNQGGLISFNCFLSTSKTRGVSLKFAERALSNLQIVGVLFVMTINHALREIPFASVVNVGASETRQDEVLFSMNTVFRIGQIKPLDNNPRLFRVELSMTRDEDNELRLLMDRIREETSPKAAGWYRLALLLSKMGESAKAQQLFETLLKQTAEESARGVIYGNLGMMADDLGQYGEAIAYYEKSIRIEEKQKLCNHQNLASSYNKIGSVYDHMGDYPKALSSLEKALAIQQQSLPPTHPALAVSYNDIGLVQENMNNISKAHSYYERAVDIAQHSLPSGHTNLQEYQNNLARIKKKL